MSNYLNLNALIVFVLGIVVGVVAAVVGVDIIAQFNRPLLLLASAGVFLAAGAIATVIVVRGFLLKRLFDVDAGKADLKDILKGFKGLLDAVAAKRAVADQDWQPLAKLVAALYFWSRLRTVLAGLVIGTLAGFVGVLGGALLAEQNELISVQSELLRTQNRLVVQQDAKQAFQFLRPLYLEIAEALPDRRIRMSPAATLAAVEPQQREALFDYWYQVLNEWYLLKELPLSGEVLEEAEQTARTWLWRDFYEPAILSSMRQPLMLAALDSMMIDPLVSFSGKRAEFTDAMRSLFCDSGVHAGPSPIPGTTWRTC